MAQKAARKVGTNGSFTPEEVRGAWIEATRLRTLPLAASGSFIAAGIAAARGAFRIEVFALMFIVSVLLQVIANFADDYGDLAHGLDDETRVGPKRGMQRGVITPAQMRAALSGMCVLTFVLGCLLIFVAFTSGPAMGPATLTAMAVFVILGLAAIGAAVLYTVGPHPYGYLGLGDIMSFIFFGLVAVIAGSFLYLHEVTAGAVIAGFALGLPVAAVMNINNMRDSAADAAKGKKTIANRLYTAGERRGMVLAAGKKPEEIASLVAVLSHGPKVDAKAFDAELRRGGAAAVKRATSPKTVAGLMGEVYMRAYHLALVYVALALFIVSLVVVDGISLPVLIGAAAVLVASTPLVRAARAVSHQLDHTKLDRFMAPTSLGTVLVSIVFTVAVTVAGLL